MPTYANMKLIYSQFFGLLKHIPALTYGRPTANAYIQMAQILKQATATTHPKQYTILIPVTSPRVSTLQVPSPRENIPIPLPQKVHASLTRV